MTGGLLVAAARVALGQPRLWAIGLAGFLARGGIIILALPIVSLPSPVGVATFIGPTAISAAGLSARLVVLLTLSAGLLAVCLGVGLVVGALADVVLVREACGTEECANRAGRDDGPMPPDHPWAQPGLPLRTLVGRLVAIRLALLMPLAIVAAWGIARLVDVGYAELTVPSDLARPLPVRVLVDAPEVVLALGVAWLAGEVVGAIAVRLAVVERGSAGRSLIGALRWLARRPQPAIGLLAATLVGSLAAVAPAVAASVVAWDAARRALLGALDPVATLAAVIAFVALWAAGLVLAGATAAWRSVAWSMTVVRDHRGTGPLVPGGGTL